MQVLGYPVCQQAYKRLLRLGSDRFTRLSTAVRNGDIDCPLDLRYSTREFTAWTDKRQIVHDFLHELHTTLAEPMPESRCCSKRPRLIKKRDDKILQRATGMVEKALPPGSFCEYLAMLRRKHPGLKCSYKLFTTAAASVHAATTCYTHQRINNKYWSTQQSSNTVTLCHTQNLFTANC